MGARALPVQSPNLTPLDEKSLSRFNIFEDFKNDTEVLLAFAIVMSTRTFKSGETIILEGDIGSEMYLLVKGSVGVFKQTASGDEYKVADLFDSMNLVFGEGALIDVDRRSATIKSLSPCECLVIDRDAFEKFSMAHPQWALPVFRRIARAVMKRLRKTNEDFLLVYNALVAEIRG